MNTIKVPYEGKGYAINYTLETIDLGLENLPFVNVYSVFIDAPELQKIVGSHFTMLHHLTQLVRPVFTINRAGDTEESNLKKKIAQQIMNEPR